jgi:hypothetical protein
MIDYNPEAAPRAKPQPLTRDALLGAGFVIGAPSPAAMEIDYRACREATCPKCGWQRLCYEPYINARMYVVLGRCPVCRWAEEF